MLVNGEQLTVFVPSDLCMETQAAACFTPILPVSRKAEVLELLAAQSAKN